MNHTTTTSLVDLLGGLHTAAGAGVLYLETDAALPGDAVAVNASRCHPAQAIVLHPEVAAGDETIAQAVLAHELAHHQLGHSRLSWPHHVRTIGTWIQASAVAALLTGSAHLAAGLALLTATITLASARSARARELAADRHAVDLLTQTGPDGPTAMTAMLRDMAADEAPWITRGGWLLSTRPAAARRLAALRRSSVTTWTSA